MSFNVLFLGGLCGLIYFASNNLLLFLFVDLKLKKVFISSFCISMKSGNVSVVLVVVEETKKN